MDKPENSNYACVVTRIKAITVLENCDNVVGIPIFGMQAISSKNVEVGQLGIVIPCESQVSEEFASENNLFCHAEKNKDTTQKGYIEDNRRVRAIKFRGNNSNCLFMPITALDYTGIDISVLQVGDEFDTINGHEICKKYVARTNPMRQQGIQSKKVSRVDSKHMPEHFDTLNYFKFMDTIGDNEEVIITQKLHGTSIRIGHTIVKRKLTLLERVAQWLGAGVSNTEYDYVFGSRKVIKDPNNPDQDHFYDSDIWTEQGRKLGELLPKNYLLYGELIGYTSEGKEIQKDYTYNLPQGTCELYIYRIAIVNEDGHITEMSWNSVKLFCLNNGLKYVPEILVTTKKDFDVMPFIDKRFFDGMSYRKTLYLGSNELVDEGVCVRAENPVRIYKAKSPKFLEHETKILDTGEEDLESTQNV